MKTTLELIAELKEKTGIESDYAIAQLLGVTKNTISLYRNGKTYMGDELILKVADILESDPAYIMACIHAEREKNQAVKKIWERFATLTAGLAALVILSVTVPQSGHESALFAAFTGSYPVYYVKSIFEYWPLFMALFIIIFLARPRNIASKK